MTIDEAIAHAREVAKKNREYCECNKICLTNRWVSNIECAKEHEQLAEWFEELKEYRELEEQGLLLRLPCKVGDTIYFVEKDFEEIEKATIESIEFGRNGFMINSDYEIGTYFSTENLFLTKKEAEQALEKMKER